MQTTRRQALTTLAATLLSLPAFAAARRGSGAPAGALATAEFLTAVRAGDAQRVRAFLASDATLAGARDESGRSAFVLAHLAGHVEVAELLRATGLELDIVESVLAEDWERMEALAQAHPELLEQAHPVGGTPLYAAALFGSLDFWRLRSLGCDPDAAPPGGTGLTPARGAMDAARSAWAQISIKDLLANGADPNARQRAGDSILHAAVRRRDESLVRLAVRKLVRVDASDDQGRTPRDLAAELSWEVGVKLLDGHATLARDHRASRFAFDANHEPVVRQDLSDVPQELQSAVTGSSHAKLEKLREFITADPRLVFSISTDDELAIEACAHTGNREIMGVHLDHGAPLSLPTAVSMGDLASIEFLLEHDPLLAHERGAHDFPVMWYVVLGRGGAEVGERLLAHDLSIDQESAGTTALHWAVLRGQRDSAAWLLESGADPEAVGHQWDRSGHTPLDLARQAEDQAMQRLLRDAGARV